MHILSLMLVASVVGVSAEGPPPQSDQEKVQGTWVVEKQDWGKTFNQVKHILPQLIQFDIKGDECTVISRNSSDDPEQTNKFTLILDPKETPGYWDNVTDGKKTHAKAIYKFEKNDSLIIAIGMADDYRPKGFDPSKESILVLVLKKKM